MLTCIRCSKQIPVCSSISSIYLPTDTTQDWLKHGPPLAQLRYSHLWPAHCLVISCSARDALGFVHGSFMSSSCHWLSLATSSHRQPANQPSMPYHLARFFCWYSSQPHISFTIPTIFHQPVRSDQRPSTLPASFTTQFQLSKTSFNYPKTSFNYYK